MATTVFSSVVDNAIAQLASASLNNVTNPVTVSVVTGQGARYGTINATGMYVTIWDKTTYPDPLSDPSMEKATITAITGDSITISRPAAVAHASAIYVGDLWRTAHYNQIATSINTLENVPAASPKLYDFLVAATGGDYTTLSAALASAPANSTYFVKGTITETAAIVCSAANVSVIGTTQSIVNLVNQAATCWTMSGANWIIQGLTIIGGTTDKGADGTGQMTLSGNYGKISNCLLKEGASTTTTYGSFMVIDGQWCEVSSNQFQSMNIGGAMVFRFNPYNRNITVRNNEILNTSGKAFFALDPTGQTVIEMKGVQIVGNNGMMTTGSARYRAIDINYSAATSCYITGGLIADNQINVVANEFIGVNGGNNADTSCSVTNNVGQGVQLGTGYAISVVQCGNAVVANNRCTDMTVYFCISCTITGNSSKNGNFTTNGNQLGANSTVTGNTFLAFTVGRSTSCVINGNVGVNSVTVNNTTNCDVHGNSSSVGSFSMSGDNSSTVHSNICLGGNLTIAGTGTIEYGNGTGSSGFVVSTTITTPRAFSISSQTALKASLSLATVVKTATYPLTLADHTVIAGTLAAAATFTTPAPSPGLEFAFNAGPSAATSNVTIATTSGTIDGAASVVLNTAYQKLKIASDGTNWFSIF